MNIGIRVGTWLAAMAALLAPALWNRFPLLQYDTGGYLARWFEGYLVPSRSVVYGLFLTAGWPLDFWPVVVVQAAAAIWILALVFRIHGFAGRPLAFLAIVVLLALTTTLPWIASILLTDIFAGLAVLALYVLVLHADRLKWHERAALIVFVAFAAATHSATLLVLLALVAAGLIASLSCSAPPCCSPRTWWWRSVWHGRPAATASCSRACCKTGSWRATSRSIVRSGI